jgi:hypothetical protein
MHYGASALFSRAVRDVLNNAYYDRWIGRGGPTAWPPRSPDLSPLDFYPWGTPKIPVYAAPVDNEEALHHRIVDACQTIRNYPGIFGRMRRPMMRGVDACIESHGEHFEHLLLYCTLSAISKTLNVSGHMLVNISFLVLACGTRAQRLSAPFSYNLYTNKV